MICRDGDLQWRETERGSQEESEERRNEEQEGSGEGGNADWREKRRADKRQKACSAQRGGIGEGSQVSRPEGEHDSLIDLFRIAILLAHCWGTRRDR